MGVLHPFIAFNFELGLGKDQHFEVTIGRDKLFDEGLLGRVVLAHHDFVADRGRHLHFIFADEVEHQGAVHVLAGDLLNVGWHCSREDHGLGLWHKALDSDNFLLEAHVEHLVTLVEYLVLRAVDFKSVVLKQVDQAARRRYNHLRLHSPDLHHYNTMLATG